MVTISLPSSRSLLGATAGIATLSVVWYYFTKERSTVDEKENRVNAVDERISAAVMRRFLSLEPGRIEIEELYIHPVKGMRGISISKGRIDTRGFVGDRRFLVVDANVSDSADTWRFVTQRQLPRLSLITPVLKFSSSSLATHGDGSVPDSGFLVENVIDASGDVLSMELAAPRMPRLNVNVRSDDLVVSTALVSVVIWGTKVPAIDCGDDCARWLTQFFSPAELEGRRLRLVREVSDMNRSCSKKTFVEGGENVVAFPDQAPFLMLSQESLEDLNSRLQKKARSLVSSRNFRGNIVVRGVPEPYFEDGLDTFKICKTVQAAQSIPFRGAASCQRCKVPTVDPNTGIFDQHNEPTATLLDYRCIYDDQKWYFGKLLTHLQPCLGTIAVGDVILPVE